jgi:hypothetical protein
MKAAVDSQYGEILVSRVIGKLPTSAVSIEDAPSLVET